MTTEANNGLPEQAAFTLDGVGRLIEEAINDANAGSLILAGSKLGRALILHNQAIGYLETISGVPLCAEAYGLPPKGKA